MNEPPGARARVALTGLTVAEYFRDQEGQDVLLFIDNIFRFTQAGSEVGAGAQAAGGGPGPALQRGRTPRCGHRQGSQQLLSPQVSALLGRIPSAVGYQPTLATDMGTMQERITTTRKGSITSVQVVLEQRTLGGGHLPLPPTPSHRPLCPPRPSTCLPMT